MMLLPRVQQVNNIQHENYQHELIKIVLLSLYITFIFYLLLLFFFSYHAMLQAGFLLVILKPPSTSTLLIKAR